MLNVIEIFTNTVVQGVLVGLTLISGAIMLYLNKKMGFKDERIIFLNLKGTNVILWVFFIMIVALYLLNPNDILVYRQFILNSFFVSIIIGTIYGIYQYMNY